MGIANIIPGISGGTIALITNIYERLIEAISGIDLKFIPPIFRGDIKSAKRNFTQMDLELLIPLFLGVVAATLAMSNVIEYLLDNYPAITYAFFIGLILAPALLLYKRIGRLSFGTVFFSILGFMFAIWLVGADELQTDHSLSIVFISGLIAICAMILPGISGAMVLLILNQYEYMLDVLKGFQILEIFIFCLGALIGILSFSRILKYVLNRYEALVLSTLTGLMLGALRLPCEKTTEHMESVFPVLVSAAVAFCLSLALGRISKTATLTD